ncbi:MAG: hydrogenase maturation protease [Planctomycetaceae bacterium]|nr:hydrogenase maturation protease [Planctomycetaceae bacterium]
MSAMIDVVGSDRMVVGIGSPQGGDQIGWLIAADLERRRLPGWRVRSARVPTDLLDWFEHCERLHLIDACQFSIPAGQFMRLEWPDPRIQQIRARTSHDLDLPQVLQLAERLGQLPHQVVLWAIEIKGESLSDSLSNRVAGIAAAIEDDIRQHA